MTDLLSYLQVKGDLIEGRLNQLVPLMPGPSAMLYEAARYSLLGGGKRLRPVMTLATVEAFKKDPLPSLTPACTLELIHTYSLIHDDLPCMDNDDFRRGKPSLHKQYNEGHAVLTGDYLLTYAFEILSNDPGISCEKKVQLIAILANRSGGQGMIGGQVMDIANEGKPLSLELMKLLHQSKTAALISAAVEFGGVMSDAGPIEMAALRLFGENIGLAFQIMDDILDVTSSEAKRGRKISSDLVNHKTTYVTLLGIDKAREAAKMHREAGIEALRQLSIDSSQLIQLADFVINRRS